MVQTWQTRRITIFSFSLSLVTPISIVNENTHDAASASKGDHQLYSAPKHSLLSEISVQTTASQHNTNQLHCCELISSQQSMSNLISYHPGEYNLYPEGFHSLSFISTFPLPLIIDQTMQWVSRLSAADLSLQQAATSRLSGFPVLQYQYKYRPLYKASLLAIFPTYNETKSLLRPHHFNNDWCHILINWRINPSLLNFTKPSCWLFFQHTMIQLYSLHRTQNGFNWD